MIEKDDYIVIDIKDLPNALSVKYYQLVDFVKVTAYNTLFDILEIPIELL